MLQVEQLTKSFGDRVLFSDISFSIERGQKVGLIAPNGTGKSTLMRILLGREPQDSGTITYERDIKQAFLPQLPDLPETGTILEACFSPYDPVAQLTLAWEIAVEAGDSQTMERLLPEMEAKGAWHYEQRAKEILGALGIHDYQRSVKGLSGGEAKRIALGSTLISQPDLLFLDEPTNHLDLKSIEWLESYLARSTMGLLLITHDRYFLDRVCNQIIELDGGRLYRYKGNYDYYLTKREERHEQEEQSRQRALNLYRRELEWMRRQPQARGTKAQYRIDAFHELETKTRPAQRTDEVQLGASSTRIGKKIFEAHHVNKCFGDKVLLQDFNYVFSRYDKVGIIGENGVGKTTFLRMLLGEIEPDSGRFDIGETIRFGYYSQEPPTFAPEKRVIDIVQEIAENFELPAGSTQVERLSASQILTRFLFPPERQYTPVEKLSGGELRRLYLCTILVTSPLLILDEPTNHLDIRSKNVLKEAILNFTGTVIIVSHDREFLDGLVSRVYEFRSGHVTEHIGGIYDWLEKRDREDGTSVSNPRAATPVQRETKTPESTTGAQDYQRQKEAAKERRALERELKAQEERSESIDAELSALEEKLADPAHATDAKLFEQYSQLKKEQEQVLARWEELSMQLEG